MKETERKGGGVMLEMWGEGEEKKWRRGLRDGKTDGEGDIL